MITALLGIRSAVLAMALSSSPGLSPPIYVDPFLWDDLVVRGTITSVERVTVAPEDWYLPVLLRPGMEPVEFLRVVINAPEVLRGRVESCELLVRGEYADEPHTLEIKRILRPGSDVVATARYLSDRGWWLTTSLFLKTQAAPSPYVGRCWRRLFGTVSSDSLFDLDIKDLVNRTSVSTMTFESDLVLRGRIASRRDVGPSGDQHQEYVVEPERVLRGKAAKQVVFEAGGGIRMDESLWRMLFPLELEVGTSWYLFLRECDGVLIPTASYRGAFRIADDQLFERYDVPSAYTALSLEKTVRAGSACNDSVFALLSRSRHTEPGPPSARAAALRELARLICLGGSPFPDIPPGARVRDIDLVSPFYSYSPIDTSLFAFTRAKARDIFELAPRTLVCFPVRYRDRVVGSVNVTQSHGRYESSGGYLRGVGGLVDRLAELHRTLNVGRGKRVSVLQTGIAGNYYIIEDGRTVSRMGPADTQTMNLLHLTGPPGDKSTFAPPDSFAAVIQDRIATTRQGLRQESSRPFDRSWLEQDVVRAELIVRGIVKSVGHEMVESDSLFEVKRPGELFPVTTIEVEVQGVLKGSWADSTVRAVLVGNPDVGGFSYHTTYNYEVEDEVTLCLHYAPKIMGGAYQIWGDAGSFVKRGKEWMTRDGNLVSLDSIVDYVRSTEPEWMARCSDAIAVGSIESVERREFDCGFPIKCVADYAKIRVTEAWRGVAPGELITVRALRIGTNLSWYAPMPQLVVGEAYLMFLRRDDVGYYAFAGFNGFLETDGEALIANDYVRYPLTKAQVLESITPVIH